LPISVRLNGTSRNGTADDRSDRVPITNWNALKERATVF